MSGDGMPPMEPMPGPDTPPPDAPKAPQTVLRAVQGMYVGAALSLLSVVVGALSRDAIRKGIEEANATHTGDSHMTPAQVDTAVTISFVSIIVIGLIGVGLWLLMAFMNRAGRSWARIVATVLAVLYVLRTLSAFVQGGGGSALNTILALLILVVAVVVTVLLYLPDSNAYFARVTEVRHRR